MTMQYHSAYTHDQAEYKTLSVSQNSSQLIARLVCKRRCVCMYASIAHLLVHNIGMIVSMTKMLCKLACTSREASCNF